MLVTLKTCVSTEIVTGIIYIIYIYIYTVYMCVVYTSVVSLLCTVCSVLLL